MGSAELAQSVWLHGPALPVLSARADGEIMRKERFLRARRMAENSWADSWADRRNSRVGRARRRAAPGDWGEKPPQLWEWQAAPPPASSLRRAPSTAAYFIPPPWSPPARTPFENPP